jgi:uncharacterized protein (DUF1778 family)
MSESVQEDLPIARPDARIEIMVSPDQNLVIRQAAQLIGWTVEQYVLSTTLDRAERDLAEHAALRRDAPPRLVAEADATAETRPAIPEPDTTVEPFVTAVTALG